MRRSLPLVAIEVFVWLILLFCTFLISRVAFAINIGTDTFSERVTTEALRVLVSGVIVLAWLFAWKKITDFYFWRTVRHKKVSA